GIGCRIGPWRVRRYRPVVDDAATPRLLLLHDLERFLRAQERARQIHVHDRLPLLVGKVLQEHAGRAAPCVVEQQVESTKRLPGLLKEAPHVLRLAHIGYDGEHPRTRGLSVLDRRLQSVGATPGDHHRIAVAAQCQRRRPTDPCPTTGHNRYFVRHSARVYDYPASPSRCRGRTTQENASATTRTTSQPVAH